jgi:hypothetical protein
MARLLFNVILLFFLIMTIVNAYYRFFFSLSPCGFQNAEERQLTQNRVQNRAGQMTIMRIILENLAGPHEGLRCPGQIPWAVLWENLPGVKKLHFFAQ